MLRLCAAARSAARWCNYSGFRALSAGSGPSTGRYVPVNGKNKAQCHRVLSDWHGHVADPKMTRTPRPPELYGCL